jgi:hypothetical protein
MQGGKAMSAFDQIRGAFLGSSGMPHPLTSSSRRRLAWLSLAPGVVLAAAIIHAAISLSYSDSALYSPSPDFSIVNILNPDILNYYGDQAPEPVRRLYAVTETLQALEPLALSLLFAAGLHRWSRAEGSWMGVIGAFLAGIAFAPGAFAVGAYAVLDQTDDRGLHVPIWVSLARTFGLMAVGYFFLAYRAIQPVRATIRRRRPAPGA